MILELYDNDDDDDDNDGDNVKMMITSETSTVLSVNSA
jgi:hypothetical protein